MKKRGERGIGGLYLDFKFILLFFLVFLLGEIFPLVFVSSFRYSRKEGVKVVPGVSVSFRFWISFSGSLLVIKMQLIKLRNSKFKRYTAFFHGFGEKKVLQYKVNRYACV